MKVLNDGKYKGASIGFTRMNRMIDYLRLHGSLNSDQMAELMDMERNQTRKYLSTLVQHDKAVFRQKNPSQPRVFELEPGAQYFDVPYSAYAGQPSRATGKKLGRRPKEKDAQGNYTVREERRITILPAKAMGMRRDPLVAALFGEAA